MHHLLCYTASYGMVFRKHEAAFAIIQSSNDPCMLLRLTHSGILMSHKLMNIGLHTLNC